MERFLEKQVCFSLAACPRVLWPFAGVSCPGAEVLPGDYSRTAEYLLDAESDLILVLLSLVDMTLVGGLLVMVMFSGL